MKWIFLTKREGRLGNRLFLCANLIAFGAEVGAPVSLLALAEYAELFRNFQRGVFLTANRDLRDGKLFLSGRMRVMVCEVVAGFARFLGRMGGLPGMDVVDIAGTYDVGDRVFGMMERDFLERVEGKGVLFLHGWKFRVGAELLRKWREEVVRVLEPVVCVRKRAEEAVGNVRRKGEWVVGVHIRRGDYRHWKGGKYFFEVGSYLEWMRQAGRLFGNKKVSYLVCSEEKYRAGDFGELAGRVGFGPGDAAGDLYALAGCDCIVGPPSTFTLWASYVGDKPLHIVERANERLWAGGFTQHEGP
ncbi:MAG: hypothetical protein N2035_07380 [Chthoniobacterales bacterium]|nr:hypothetical protein [Chthoniobacterales bacterium]